MNHYSCAVNITPRGGMFLMADGQTPGDRIRIAREEARLTQGELAERCGWDSQSRIGNYERNLREPNRTAYITLGKALGVSPAYLQFGRVQAGMPLGDYNVDEGPSISGRAPLISWVKAGAFHEPADPYQVGQAEDWFPMPRKAGPRTFALRVRGVSMEPRYHDGDIIFVDPDAEARHGSRVVVRLENEKEATFKELVIEGDQRFLKALNPLWPDPLIRINGEATICGVVIGRWVEE